MYAIRSYYGQHKFPPWPVDNKMLIQMNKHKIIYFLIFLDRIISFDGTQVKIQECIKMKGLSCIASNQVLIVYPIKTGENIF